MNNRFVIAKKFATNIVREYSLTPPIEPEAIIREYGYEIIEEGNQLGIEAFSMLGDVPKIIINPEFSYPARRKFTLAHELGHIIIPWHNGDTKCNTDKPYTLIQGVRFLDTQELEANTFASELLMPYDWLKEQISCFFGKQQIDFENLVKSISKKAGTSYMACFYALENVLPSGCVYYVKTDGNDFWKKFSSPRTDVDFQFNLIDDKYSLNEYICNTVIKFSISNYNVAFYQLCPCPTNEVIDSLYDSADSISEFVNIITDYQPLKIIPSLNYLIDYLNDSYFVCLYKNNYRIRTIKKANSKLKCKNNSYEYFVGVLKNNNILYETIEVKDYKILFILEKEFIIPKVSVCNANHLLKQITQELYEGSRHKLLSINGIVSNINSTNKTANKIELYNRIKYRFATDIEFVDFYNNDKFDKYVINKIDSMIEKRNKNYNVTE